MEDNNKKLHSIFELRKRFKKENPDKAIYAFGETILRHNPSYVFWLQDQLIENTLKQKHTKTIMPDEKQNTDKTIKSVVSVGDVIEAEYLGNVYTFKIEKFEVILNNDNIRPVDWVILMKVSYYDEGHVSTIECTSDNFKYIKHIWRETK